jgi:DNA-binding NtrC family response regulator
MMKIAWEGDPPPPSWARGLRAAGVAVARPATARSGRGADCLARVIYGQSPPRGHAGQHGVSAQPWIFLGRGERSRPGLQTAVLAGAYDAFPALGAGAIDRLLRRLRELAEADEPPPETPEYVTQSEAGRRLLRSVWRAARTSQPVLLTGETGTGKEVIARLLHRFSPRHEHHFVPINCAAIPNELMEAELFGYSRGAFSGAVQRYDGQLMAAQRGTVFLDEVDDTPLPVQTKLLRVLEDHVVSRLGENEWHRVDFRLIAATNRDLRPLIAGGQFGADLYQRLAIVSIELPPLRERIDDLPLLIDHFVARFAQEEPSAGRRPRVTQVTEEAMTALRRYRWPGNVRELRNVLFAALVGKRGGSELLLSDLPAAVVRGESPILHMPPGTGTPAKPGLFDSDAIERRVGEGRMNLRVAVAELERTALRAALRHADGNATEAARLLGEVGRGRARDPGGTLRAMMRRLRVGGATRPSRRAG